MTPLHRCPMGGIRILACLSLCVSCAGRPGAVRHVFQRQRPERVAHPMWLANYTSDELYGALSSDGRRLIYSSNQKGSFDIWQRDLTTGLAKRLTRHSARDSQPAWSPDGETFAFMSLRSDAKGDIYLQRNGKRQRLTGGEFAEAHPCFSADGKAVYFAQGADRYGRVMRIQLDERRIEAIGPRGTTHPANDHSGRYLAMTRFDSRGRSRIVVMRLADRKLWPVTTTDYHTGFPAFSADGRQLLFSRFHRGRPMQALADDTPATLWRVALADVIRGTTPETLMARAVQLTGAGQSALFVRPHRHGLVFSAQRGNNLDVGWLPHDGVLPPGLRAEGLLSLAAKGEDPWQSLLLLRRAGQLGPLPLRRRAQYRASQILREVGEFSRAAKLLDELATTSSTDLPVLRARVDRLILKVEAADSDRKRRRRAEQVLVALQHLPPTAGQALRYRRMRQADLLRLCGRRDQAAEIYREMISGVDVERATAAEAELRLAQLRPSLQEPALLSDYYLRLIERYPNQARWQGEAEEQLIALTQGWPAKSQLAWLRRLVDGVRRMPRLVARAELRIAALQQRLGNYGLAIRSLARAASWIEQAPRLGVKATFALGRSALSHSKRLRKQGRLHEALRYYSQARRSYKTLVASSAANAEQRDRARQQYLRLSILEALQLERDGDHRLAERRYRELIEFDNAVWFAHRRLITLKARQGSLQRLAEDYRRQLNHHAKRPSAHYALGYIATFSRPLDDGALEAAAEHLERAIDLRPQSPFGHMTLGWVYAMREKYLRQLGKGWLEEAIVAYQRAYELNDGRADTQTEADLLLNLCQSFADLGNGWEQAYRFCKRRHALKLPFLEPKRRLSFLLIFGRSSSATGHHELASDQFERAFELAQSLKLPTVEAEIAARMGLNAHLRRKYKTATRHFRHALSLAEKLGQTKVLAGLSRSIAHNLLLGGDITGAKAALGHAEALLARHGARAFGSWSPVGDVGRSTAPFGFDEAAERDAQRALRALLMRRQSLYRQAEALLAAQYRSRKAEAEQRQDQEISREVAQLSHRRAVTAWRLGKREAFYRHIEAAETAISRSTEASKPPQGTITDIGAFALRVALALNASEAWLTGRPAIDEAKRGRRLQQLVRRLNQLETQRRGAAAKEPSTPILSQRLRLALWSNLAQLLWAQSLQRNAREDNPPRSKTAAEALVRAQRAADGQRRALRLLREVEGATRPAGSPPQEPEPPNDAFRFGTLSRLWRPLSFLERLRWHTRTGLNLARMATRFTATDRLSEHRSNALLSRLAEQALKYDLGALKYAIAAELAWRDRDSRAMRLAVDGYLQRSPLLLGSADRRSAAQTCRQIFERALDLSLAQGDARATLSYLEQWDRRAFVDALIAAGPRGYGHLAAPISKLVQASGEHAALIDTQGADRQRPSQAAWMERRDRSERQVLTALQALRTQSAGVAALFEVPPFPSDKLEALLSADKAVLLSAFVHRQGAWLISVRGQSLRLARLDSDHAAAISRALGSNRDARHIYLDLGRLPAGLAQPVTKGQPRLSGLTNAWELLDARGARITPNKGGLFVATADATLPEHSTLQRVVPKRVSERLLQRLERAPKVVWQPPLYADGGSAANLRLHLGPAPQGGIRLAKTLGLPFRAHLWVFEQQDLHRSLRRPERVALARLLHAAGVSTFALGQASPNDKRTLTRGGDRNRQRLQYFGDARRGAAAAQRADAAQVHTWQKTGTERLKQKRLGEAVDYLQRALAAMSATDRRAGRQAATLLQLVQAYTLEEDYRRALAVMKRLVMLREAGVSRAKQQGKARGLLIAQARLVKTLVSMGWVRLRNQQFSKALKVNRRAIDLYHAVGRPLLAGPAYEQRSLIAERQGNLTLALHAATERLQIAKKRAAGGKAATLERRIKLASAALRQARLMRAAGRDLVRAADTVERALGALATVPAASLAALRADFLRLNQQLGSATAKRKAALKRRLALALAKGKRVRTALITRVELNLEAARIQAARANYRGAVRRARQGLELAEAAKLPGEHTALLEIVNNLYYLGAYDEALSSAERGLAQTKANPLRQIQFSNAKGTVLSALGRAQAAKRALRYSLGLARKIGRRGEVAASHNNLGDSELRSGNLREAKHQFEAALRLDEEAEDRYGLAFDLANLGRVEFHRGRHQQASNYLKRAIAISRAIGAPLNQLKARITLGRIALANKDSSAALVHFGRGKRLAQSLGLRDWLWRFLLWQGRAQRLAKQPQRARAAFDNALQIVESRPPRLRPALATRPLEVQPEAVYDELIDLLADQGQSENALDLNERLLARQMVDLLSASSGQLPEAAGGDLLRALISARGELEVAQADRLRQGAKAVRLAPYQQRVRQAERAVRAFNPRLLELGQVRVAPYRALRQQLMRHADTLFVCYYTGRRRLWLWLVQGQQINLQRVDVPRQRLERAVAAFRHGLLAYHAELPQAKALYNWLWKAIDEHLTNKRARVRRIVLVRSGPLHVLPFAALNKRGKPLVARYALSSLRALSELARQGTNAAGKTPSTSTVRAITFSPRPSRQLRFARQESAVIARRFGAKWFDQAQATLGALRAHAVGAQVLHLATHAAYRPEAPLRSTMQLARQALELREVVGLPLQSEIVVLSACETGLGDIRGAAGITGFQQAFLLAGAKRVLSTLWRVSDLGSALVMKHFFRRLSNGQNPALALQHAQNTVRKRFAHPAFWAGYRLDGIL